jgi:outer membrane lipoprotein-sorting protein
MAAQAEPIDLPGLVILMYRADWTRLCLSAGVRHRQDDNLRRQMHGDKAQAAPTEELAPGGRYRIEVTDEEGTGLTVCDGQSQWALSEGVAERTDADGPPFPGVSLLAPSGLLAQVDLEVAGTSVVGGRAAHRVVVTPRPVASRVSPSSFDRAFALVDAELGILLSYEEVLGGQQLTLTELTDVRLDPPAAAEPGQFRPPAGMPVRDKAPIWDRDYVIPGVAGQVARLVAGPAAAAVGFAARHAPMGTASDPAQTDEVIPAPRRVPAQATPEPVSDDLVKLLYGARSRPLTFTAEIHTWMDEAVQVRLLAAARATMPAAINGILGPDQLWDALADRARGTTHRITRLMVAPLGRYRIDHLAGGRPDRPTTIACDGERLWKVYPNRVATGPAKPPGLVFARLADQSALLSGWELSAAGEVEVDGRRGFLLVVKNQKNVGGRHQDFAVDQSSGWLSDHVEVVIDAELGIALRETTYYHDDVVTLIEARNVRGQVEPGAFRVEIAPGTRTVRVGPLSEIDLRRPLKVAKIAGGLGATGVVAGAVALTGWLQKRPGQPPGD